MVSENRPSILVLGEGPTEWRVASQLFKRGLLRNAQFLNHDLRKISQYLFGNLNKLKKELIAKNEKKGYLINPPASAILALIDLEDQDGPRGPIRELGDYISRFDPEFQFQPHDRYENIMLGRFHAEDRETTLPLVVHFADRPGVHSHFAGLSK